MRNIYLALLTSAILAPMSIFAADGDVFTYNNLKYKVLSETDKTCQVSDNSGITGDVVIPETAENNGNSYRVTEIGASAFFACRDMSSITIPNSVTAIRERAFDSCSGLENLVIPNSVTVLEYRSVYGCTGLTSLSISNGLTEIAPSTFSGCGGLTSLTIPDSVEKIGEEAFNFCKSLITIELSKNLKEIGLYGFSGCIRLYSITFPASMTNVDSRAFSYCERLTDVTIESGQGTLIFGEEVFGERTYKDSWAPVKKIVINRNFSCTSTVLKYQPFAQLTTLSSIEFGASVTNIGANAFAGCSTLNKIDIKAPIPPTAVSSSFDTYSYNNAAVRVPESSLESYRQHNIWKQFKNMKGENWPGITDYTIEISQATAEIKVDETVALTFNVTPEEEPTSVVWTSSANDIATVDENGVVTGIAQGNAVITVEVTLPNAQAPVKAECNITVTEVNNIEAITIDANSTVEAYRTDGSLALKGTLSQLRSLESGLYIVRTNKGVCKIVIK